MVYCSNRNITNQKSEVQITKRCSAKKVFLEISQNSQKNTCARVSFLIKLQASGLWYRCFSVNFAKFLRTLFLQNTFRCCFLKIKIAKVYLHVAKHCKFFRLLLPETSISVVVYGLSVPYISNLHLISLLNQSPRSL